MLKDRLHKIERWFGDIQTKSQGNVDTEILFLEKTKAKDILDLDFFNFERKVN